MTSDYMHVSGGAWQKPAGVRPYQTNRRRPIILSGTPIFPELDFVKVRPGGYRVIRSRKSFDWAKSRSKCLLRDIGSIGSRRGMHFSSVDFSSCTGRLRMENNNQRAGPSRRRANSIPIRPIASLETSLAAPLTRLLSHPDAAVVSPGRNGSSLPTITSTPCTSRPSSPPLPEESPYPGAGTPEDPFLVDWLPDEPSNPYNWRPSFKWMNMAVIAISALCISFASSSYSAAIPDVMRQLHGKSQEEGIAGLSLYVLGQSQPLGRGLY